MKTAIYIAARYMGRCSYHATHTSIELHTGFVVIMPFFSSYVFFYQPASSHSAPASEGGQGIFK